MTALLVSMTEPVGPEGAPMVVLGPSLGTSTILWQDVIPVLARTHRVVAWDLPGHGRSPAIAEPWTIAQLADAIAAAVPAERFACAGVSMGGAACLELLLRHPDRVESAAVVASGAHLGDASAWHERAEQARRLGTASLVVQSAERWFAPGSIARRPQLAGRLLHALRDADDEGYARCCEALATYDVRPRLGEITAPVLAAWGEHDAVAPHALAAALAGAVSDGRVARVAAASHLPPAEQPRRVAHLLAAFLADIQGSHDAAID